MPTWSKAQLRACRFGRERQLLMTTARHLLTGLPLDRPQTTAEHDLAQAVAAVMDGSVHDTADARACDTALEMRARRER